MCHTLATRARNVVGTDISVQMVHAARSKHIGLSGVGADVRELPFGDGAFDVIVSNSTLDHFDSQAEIGASLCELCRVASPSTDAQNVVDPP